MLFHSGSENFSSNAQLFYLSNSDPLLSRALNLSTDALSPPWAHWRVNTEEVREKCKLFWWVLLVKLGRVVSFRLLGQMRSFLEIRKLKDDSKTFWILMTRWMRSDFPFRVQSLTSLLILPFVWHGRDGWLCRVWENYFPHIIFNRSPLLILIMRLKFWAFWPPESELISDQKAIKVTNYILRNENFIISFTFLSLKSNYKTWIFSEESWEDWAEKLGTRIGL